MIRGRARENTVGKEEKETGKEKEQAKDIMVEMTTPAGTIEEAHPSSDEEEEEYELGFDEMEASLLNEDYSLNKGAMSASNANLGKRINLVSKTVENDINRSEKSVHKILEVFVSVM